MTPKTLDKYIAALKKKAAAGGWSVDQYQAELDKIKNEMAQQYLDDKITGEEYTKVSKQLENAEKNPGLLGKSFKAPAAQTSSGKSVAAPKISLQEAMDKKKAEIIKAYDDGQMTLDENAKLYNSVFEAKTVEEVEAIKVPSGKKIKYSDLYDQLVDVSDEKISADDAMKLTDMVSYLEKSKMDPLEAKKKMEAAISLIEHGAVAEKAMEDAAGYQEGTKAQAKAHVQNVPSGMTHEEYIGLWEALNKKKKAGLITPDEYSALGAKLDQAKKDKKTVQDIAKEIGCDPGTLATDESVLKLGKELKKVYGEASKEIQAEMDAYLKKFGPEIHDLEAKFIDGTITEDELKHLKLMTLQKNILNQKADQLAGVMLNANQKAMGMINGEQLTVFAENANWQSYQLTQDTKMNLMFSVYDEHTAAKLLKDKPELLPRKEVNGKKDKSWNQKVIANAVLQGVIQGDSIPKLAKRIAVQTGETNMKAMVRYARTAMTSAQNSGRMEMLHRAKGMGIQCKKVWLATLDSRTRDAHGKMDGQKVDVDGDFQSDFGPIRFPGDLSSKGSVPANIYNCRCTLVYDYEGFPNDPTADQRMQYDEWDETVTVTKKDKNGKEYEKEEVIHHREGSLITDMSYGEWKTAKAGSKLNDLNAAKYQLAEAQKAVVKAGVKEDKVYEGLWKDPVTLKDYQAKKAGIQAKRDYYDQEIQKYKDAQAMGSSWATDDKIKELEKKKKLLNEFEKRGELIEKRDNALKAVQDIYGQVGYQGTAAAPAVAKAKKTAKKAAAASGGANTGTVAQTGAGLSLSTAGGMKTQFAPDAWDAVTKNAARNFSGKVTADKELRPELDAMWDTLTDVEKYGIWEYTRNSHPMNQPLAGFNDGWGRSRYFVGIDKTHWGHQDNYNNRNFGDAPKMAKFGKANGHPSYHKAITELTKALEKSQLKKGIWLVRGSDEEGFAGLFESGGSGGLNFNNVMSLLSGGHSLADIKKALVGQTGQNHSFTSTGVATGTGFSGSVKYRIYAPKGTKGIYAEPQSYWGGTASRNIYKKGQSYSHVSGEAEIIIQRGTRYRITDVRGGPGNWQIDMEVVEQPDYFKNGDENTYNGGKTRQKD